METRNRTISFDQAKRDYPQRFTCEHVPQWAKKPCEGNGKFYAPQYKTDAEWYENTFFNGENELANNNYCHSFGATWPLGQWLDSVAKIEKTAAC
jgi:hypothetical protein